VLVLALGTDKQARVQYQISSPCWDWEYLLATSRNCDHGFYKAQREVALVDPAINQTSSNSTSSVFCSTDGADSFSTDDDEAIEVNVCS
jgi:hypothetical protein